MIELGTAIRFDKLAPNCRTEPLLLNIQTRDNLEHEVYAKVSFGNACNLDSLVNEMLGALLAVDLGLPITEVFFVEFLPEFVDSIPNEDVKSRLRSSNTIGFASKNAGNQWRKWNSEDKVLEDQKLAALGIMAFDGFIENADRSPINSNLLVKEDEWRIIDHELAFSFLLLIGVPGGPWSPNYLQPMRSFGTESEHIFCKPLIKSSELNFNYIESQWSKISDTRLELYLNTLPNSWKASEENFKKKLLRIKEVRDNIPSCLQELKRVIRYA